VYGPPGTQYINAIETFKKAYPKIRMTYVPGSGSQHANRLGAERRAGKFIADIYVGGAGTGGILAEKGMFDPLPPLLILPQAKDQSAWFRKKHHYADSRSSLFLMEGTVTSTIALYNTKRHKPGELKSFKDLLDPKWRGKMVSDDPTARGRLATWKGIYYNDKLGPKFIQRLFAEQKVTLARSIVQKIDWVARGRYELYIAARGTEVATAKKQGLPVEIYRAPSDEAYLSGGWGQMAVVNRAPNPNAATVFANWMVSKEGQIAWQKNADRNSMRMDIPKGMITDKFMVAERGGGYMIANLYKYRDISGLRKLIAKAKADSGMAARKRK
ncbi:MAG: extracellular solute-binding protein, partial [Deltaproteobacteria bacterium]|nr:extracellular solute-binding protein [Deltaproteobacteria bacterium]